jgi:DNA-3-methyladenine glycosylase
MANAKLPRRFYTRENTLQVARDLLGKLLVVPASNGSRVSGVVVETEAYMGPEDKGSHAFGNRRTKRTEPMFGEGGHAYIYFVYGMHYQFNVVTNVKDVPHAVLIRAVEPVEGIDWMKLRRGMEDEVNLANGPGKLCQALGIDLELNTADLTGDRIWIEKRGTVVSPESVRSGPRVGIDYAKEFVSVPWRFWIDGNRFVSKSSRKRKEIVRL